MGAKSLGRGTVGSGSVWVGLGRGHHVAARGYVNVLASFGSEQSVVKGRNSYSQFATFFALVPSSVG